MFRRGRVVLTILSTAALALLVGVAFLAPHLDSRKDHLTLWPGLYVTAQYGGDLDVRLSLFTEAHGPYCGGLLAFGTTTEGWFGDTRGIYYRHLKSAGVHFYTLSVSIWYGLVACSLWPLYVAFQWNRRRRLHGAPGFPVDASKM